MTQLKTEKPSSHPTGKSAYVKDIYRSYEEKGLPGLRELLKGEEKGLESNPLLLLTIARTHTDFYLRSHSPDDYPGCKKADNRLKMAIESCTPENPISTVDAMVTIFQASSEAEEDAKKYFGKTLLFKSLRELVQDWYTKSALLAPLEAVTRNAEGYKIQLAELEKSTSQERQQTTQKHLEELKTLKFNLALEASKVGVLEKQLKEASGGQDNDNISVHSAKTTASTMSMSGPQSKLHLDSRQKKRSQGSLKFKPAEYLYGIVKKLDGRTLEGEANIHTIEACYLHLRPFIAEDGRAYLPETHPRYPLIMQAKEILEMTLDLLVKTEARQHHEKIYTAGSAPKYDTTINSFTCNFYKQNGYLFEGDPSKVKEYYRYWHKLPSESGLLVSSKAEKPKVQKTTTTHPAGMPSATKSTPSKRISGPEGLQSPTKKVCLSPVSSTAAAAGASMSQLFSASSASDTAVDNTAATAP